MVLHEQFLQVMWKFSAIKRTLLEDEKKIRSSGPYTSLKHFLCCVGVGDYDPAKSRHLTKTNMEIVLFSRDINSYFYLIKFPTLSCDNELASFRFHESQSKETSHCVPKWINHQTIDLSTIGDGYP